jgi:hypothetical protein
VGISVTPPPATVTLSAATPTVIIGSSAVLAVITVPVPHPHLAAKHHDPVGYSVELALAGAVLFVGGKLVAGRIFRL